MFPFNGNLMRLEAFAITLGILISSSAANSQTMELSFESLHQNNGITSVSSHLISSSKNKASHHNSPSMSIEQQMIFLGEWLGDQSGSDFISQTGPLVTENVEGLSFPSASFILAKAYHSQDETQQDDRIWIVENSLNWQHQLTTNSESDKTTEWYIQTVKLSTVSSDDGDDDFCNGMPMIMAMRGFQWSFGEQKDKPDCLNYLVPPWKLDNSGRFLGAMVYSFLLGIVTEGITNFQIWIRPHLGTGRLRKLIMPLLYAIQQWLGYIMMMVTMMYSIELFASVLLGLMVGRVLFLPRSTTRLSIPTTSVRATGVETVATSTTRVESEDTPLLDRTSSAVRRRRR
jgi:hypothetical protein